MTLNGLAAADSVLVPMQCEYFALEGITLLLQTVQKVQKEINPKLTIGGIFFTMYDSRTRLAQDVVLQVKSYFKDVVFNTIIPRNVDFQKPHLTDFQSVNMTLNVQALRVMKNWRRR